MKHIAITIVGDGSSDACLVPLVNWIISNGVPNIQYRVEFARHLPPAREGLKARVEKAFSLYPCDILIVHRDAENGCPRNREDEIFLATCDAGIPVVPAVPVRMLESWLLCSEEAIRHAADNPNGRTAINLPPVNRIENQPDPKQILFDSLKAASELTGRRLSKFRVEQRRFRVAELIEDYSPLRNLPSFRNFESGLIKSICP